MFDKLDKFSREKRIPRKRLGDKLVNVESLYEKSERKIERAKSKSPERFEKINKKYGYDEAGAVAAGLGPDETGHWPSRDPITGRIFKGKNHPTFYKTLQGEKEAGYEIYKKGGNLYSKEKK